MKRNEGFILITIIIYSFKLIYKKILRCFECVHKFFKTLLADVCRFFSRKTKIFSLLQQKRNIFKKLQTFETFHTVITIIQNGKHTKKQTTKISLQPELCRHIEDLLQVLAIVYLLANHTIRQLMIFLYKKKKTL